MDERILTKLLPSILPAKGQATITVTGISMNPVLFEGDQITIQRMETYEEGDILVYFYGEEGILVHRLIAKGKQLYCKGDNAFRIERISPEQIMGKVVLVNNNPLPFSEEWKIFKKRGQ